MVGHGSPGEWRIELWLSQPDTGASGDDIEARRTRW